MINAREELLAILKHCSNSNTKGEYNIKCAYITLGDKDSYTGVVKTVVLVRKYTEKDLQTFFENLDFLYDDGYGGQELFGNVWLEDGTWLSRGEYDGSEWWYHVKEPDIPEQCYKIHPLSK